jgi:hypothetical protein
MVSTTFQGQLRYAVENEAALDFVEAARRSPSPKSDLAALSRFLDNQESDIRTVYQRCLVGRSGVMNCRVVTDSAFLRAGLSHLNDTASPRQLVLLAGNRALLYMLCVVGSSLCSIAL